jgi:predicted PurR-regulated permease PerM
MLGVLGTMVVAQFLESNILTPWIMGDRVALNPLATVAGVIGFGIIWGVPGTMLAVPVIGVAKTVFNHIPSLELYGYLLGFNSGRA